MTKILLASVAFCALMLAPFSVSPVQAQSTKSAPSSLGSVDTNNDGAVSKAESDASAVKQLKEFDANKDGTVSKQEFANHMKKTMPMPKDAKMAERIEKSREEFIDVRFKALDANKDGKVTEDEVKSDSSKRFAQMDANKDGKVTRAEIDQLREQMMKKAKSAPKAPAKTQEKAK
jgi:Ca2+-binding EF-hand superfamily protein